MRNKSKTKRAFTLIETLVAISVLLISLTGPLSIAVQSLNSAYYARDQITAFYLAQEAVEYVRAVRDENYLAKNTWLAKLDNCVSPATCTVNFPDFTHAVCSGVCTPVLLNKTTGLFGDNTGEATLYTRMVSLVADSEAPDEIIVKVVITWRSSGINRQFEINEHLLNWLGT